MANKILTSMDGAGRDFVDALMQGLGIDKKRCTGFDIHVAVGEPIRITVHGYAEAVDGLLDVTNILDATRHLQLTDAG